MSLERQIQEDLKAAMFAKNATALASIRGIKAAIMLAKTAPDATDELTDADIIKIIQKLVKQRKESAAIYTEQSRPELAEAELAEAAIMEKYLPVQMSEEEVEEALKKIIAQVGAKSPADMGKVMGVATKALAGQADGRLISIIVKRLLS
ncbi:MAG TPA: GatB/YqeY domain-containing protein [Bacteroidales bacterium]|nr:GatB/YqeY domain-containing protein [Bacteroidales bacterium]